MPNIDHSNVPRSLDALGISDISTGDVMAQVLGELYKNCQGHLERLDVLVDAATRYVTPGDPTSGIDYANHTFRLTVWARDIYEADPADVRLTDATDGYHARLRRIRDAFAANATELRQLMLLAPGMQG